MRIIAGEWRGRRIDAPKGEGTRPTIDRVRESLMSVLSSARGGFEGAIVLDAFAGSGALGLEALSRGAASARFFECDRTAQRALARNIELVGVDARRAQMSKADVLARPPVYARPPFDLVLLDPPYSIEPACVFDMLEALADAGALADGAIVSYEHDRAHDVAAAARASTVSWRAVSSKAYGKVLVDVFAYEGDAAQGASHKAATESDDGKEPR